ncbi:putative transcriptional regulator [Rubricella aquisinus]|uniref:Putative transcriptional regulator n=1 Tax=Rubricella aquisinus TaxID=2028108 RepID=A0A840WJT8_9RHOB|nr:metalloregulator ArsR/SmtB family transcription factor [Rubricella aquisinus]MBB5514443.1 putative transcriptional regulator [Rubricella aquisinus]
METSDALTAFAALSQEMRLRALRLLIEAGPEGMAAGDIARALDARQNTLSTNLSILVQAGLIQNTRHGRVIRYSVNWAGMRGIITYLMQDCCGGNPDQCRPLLNSLPDPT